MLNKDLCCLCLQKGFPLNASLDVLIAYFEKIAPVDTVYMRRDQDKKFKVNEWDNIYRSLSTCVSNMHLFYRYILCLNPYLCNKQIQPCIYIFILKMISCNDVNDKKYYKGAWYFWEKAKCSVWNLPLILTRSDLALSQGSVFITFTKKEDVEKFLAEPETKYEDAVLIKKSK